MPDRFDEAVDRAVREMLDLEPRADLRARVMAQLPASGARRPASGFRLPAAGWVLAATAVIVLSVFVARRSEPPPRGLVLAGDRHLPAEATPVQKPGESHVREATRLHVIAPPSPAPSAAAGTVVATALTLDDHATTVVDPLKTIVPIAVAPVEQDSLGSAEISVRPLKAIAEMQIAPLTPPDRR